MFAAVGLGRYMVRKRLGRRPFVSLLLLTVKAPFQNIMLYTIKLNSLGKYM